MLSFESYRDIPEGTNPKYELALTNLEVKLMFGNMIRDWFSTAEADYNDFIKAMLLDDIDAMNVYMSRVIFSTFSYFDTGSGMGVEEPERFYHGFVLGLIVDLQDRYLITSNRESSLEETVQAVEENLYTPAHHNRIVELVKFKNPIESLFMQSWMIILMMFSSQE